MNDDIIQCWSEEIWKTGQSVWNLEESEKAGLKLSIQKKTHKDHGIWSHHFMANRWGNNGNSDRLFSWAPKSLQMVTAAMKLNQDTCSLKEKL